MEEERLFDCVGFRDPICIHHRKLTRDLEDFSVSLFYLVGLFDLWGGIRTLFISAAGAYGIAAYFKGPLMPWIGFVFLMGHMLVSHLYRELYPQPGVVDVTGAQMVLVMKVRTPLDNVRKRS